MFACAPQPPTTTSNRTIITGEGRNLQRESLDGNALLHPLGEQRRNTTLASFFRPTLIGINPRYFPRLMYSVDRRVFLAFIRYDPLVTLGNVNYRFDNPWNISTETRAWPERKFMSSVYFGCFIAGRCCQRPRKTICRAISGRRELPRRDK